MTLRNLPEAKTFQRPQNFQWDAPSDVMARWATTPMAADSSGDNVITIFDVIGEDYWSGGGFTAKRASAALRSIGERDVRVQVNSPGGDMFEGIAIYNMLRAHKGKVTIEVMGWAASAASIIAMAGDEIVMGLGSFMMVHNAWGMVVGNRHDMREAASMFDGFDSAIADIYEARTGAKRNDIESLMDAETFMGAGDAVKSKFADRVDESLKLDQSEANNSVDRDSIKARRQVEAALARSGFSRNQRSDLLSELGANPGARRDASPNSAARDAGEDVAAYQQLIDILKS
ncbi:head maturation protease, ClpP-related [Rhizobium halophytocola]|uniref:ATP-dependent Clp protease proteolytic subunit n=1 Tax=Rhizobium halophytocola TaxID=735519 RepID=A0ABS4DVH1_9HYPH|nr:head maturation protease, ClpP-related [Rhizobium halophytocola]MBP1849686.1 ATP-dependent protease ClpP protease subunit [Rhizobium halophytocola]